MAADMAVELKKQNVACVSLWPGAVMTEHVNDFLSHPQDEIVIFLYLYFLPLPPPPPPPTTLPSTLPRSMPQLHLQNSEEKFDVRKIKICDIMGLDGIFRKNKMKKALLPKISF